MEPVLTALISHGPLGIFAAVFLYLYVQKDKELAAERKARIDDAREVRGLVIQLQKESHEDIDVLCKVGERLDKAMQQYGDRRSRGG